MKNSAETKAGFGLSSIDEHRLSLSLLAMLLLAGTGYGIWVAVLPLLPSSAANAPASRNQIGDSHFGKGQFPKAIKVYREMLADDPDNGYVLLKIAAAQESQLNAAWIEYDSLESTTGDSRRADQALSNEAQLTQTTIDAWSRLKDNTRYRRRALVRMACIHSNRFRKWKDPAEADKAIALLDEMIQQSYTTLQGMWRTNALLPLREHPQFSRLVQQEKRLFNVSGDLAAPGLFRPNYLSRPNRTFDDE